MKEMYEISIDLPFGDYAVLNYELTDEEYDELMEFFCDNGIWDDDRYDDLLSAAAVAAANYIVGSYCEDKDSADLIDDYSCTPERLMEYLGQDEDCIAEMIAGDGQYKREIIADLLYNHQAFCLDQA